MKKRLIYFLVSLIVMKTVAFSQYKEDDYKKKADEIRSSIWAWNFPSFQQRTVPAGYEEYSRVIIARREEVSFIVDPKVKLNLASGPFHGAIYTHTFRELVKINDAAAREDYSALKFEKFSQYFKNKRSTFLGVRIIKPNGVTEEVNPDEIVLTENEKKYKVGKLAIPGLQIGDMIDYFIETVRSYNTNSYATSDEFVFASDDPLLHYSVHIELGDQMALEYESINKAPQFNIGNYNGRTALDVAQDNLPLMPVDLWMSPYRQLPFLRVAMGPRYGAQRVSVHRPGSSNSENIPDYILNGWKNTIISYEDAARKSLNSKKGKIKALAESYLAHNGGGDIKSNSVALYYAARHVFYLQPDTKDVTLPDLQSDNSLQQSVWFLSILSVLFDANKFDGQFIILPSRYGPRAGDAMFISDLVPAIVTNDGHIYTAGTAFDMPDHLPYDVEGQQATSLFAVVDLQPTGPGKRNYDLSYSSPDKNVHEEDLTVSFDPGEKGQLKIERRTVLTGDTKLALQKWLLLPEDYYEEERQVMGTPGPFSNELNDAHNDESVAQEYKSLFDQARKEWKDDCTDEIEWQFDTKAETLSSCSVEQAGIFGSKPNFIYRSAFLVSDWVKSAGDNYILEAGKLVALLKIKSEYRERKEDVYMKYATTFKYNIQIPVPAGFSVEGLDKLNNKLENSTGSFMSAAELQSDTIKIKVVQIFKHNFERIAQWPQLLQVVDAGAAFQDVKVLLRKS